MTEPILAVVFLRGGADGLGLVCPASDDNLIAARPEDLRVPRKGDGAGRAIAQQVADVDFRFRARLAAFADLYDAGDLSLIHASGMTEATRSHFDAEARIERGLFGAMPPGDPSGWIGRWLAAAAQPAILLANSSAVSESLGDLMVASGHWLAPALRARLAAGFGDHGPLAAPMAGLLHLSQMIGQRLWSETDQALLNYRPAVNYPENPLTPSLMTVAQAIKQDMGLRVATVDFGSWDTHVAQSGPFAEMAGWLAQSVMAFWRDLGTRQQDVSVVVMSEFGRRLRANSAGGTDHGRGNVMFVLGPQAKGGRMVGRWPGLTNEVLEEGADLAVVTDYRTVLAEVLTGHMGLADTGQVFPGFVPAPLGLWG